MVRTLIMLVSLTLVGCGLIPTETLNNYSASFGKVRDASEEFFIQFGQTKKTAQAFIANNATKVAVPYIPYPNSLPTSSAAGSSIDNDVNQMRLAFEVINNYNNTLVTLAEGKSVETVGSAAKGLATALGNFVPIAGTINAAVVTLAQEFEKARLREEFKKAIKNGAPIVKKILNTISDNVDTNYNTNALLATHTRTILVSEIIDHVTALQAVVSGHVVPAGPFKSLADRQAELDKALTPISRETPIAPNYPYPLRAGQNGGYSADTDAQVTSIQGEINEKIKRYQAQITKINELAESATAYKQMLSITLKSLTILENADQSAPDLTKQASEMLRWAFLVKSHVEAVRAAGTLQ